MDKIKTVAEIRGEVIVASRELPELAQNREEALGLTHRKDDEVIDARTGKKYRVIAGTRKSVAVHIPGS